MALLLDDVLADQSVATAGPLRDPIIDSLERLGACVKCFDHTLDDDGAEAWARANAPLSGLVYDACTAFGVGGRDGLSAAVEHGWPAIRAVAAGALIPAGGGRIVLIAPRLDALPHARAAQAAIENVARTLSIEWARHAITATAIVPGKRTQDGQLGALVGFLLSPAGGYYSGCRFELDAVSASS